MNFNGANKSANRIALFALLFRYTTEKSRVRKMESSHSTEEQIIDEAAEQLAALFFQLIVKKDSKEKKDDLPKN